MTDRRPRRDSRLGRYAAFAYGLTAYVLALATVAYAVGFLADVDLLPKTVDSGPAVPLAEAVVVNVALVGLFGLQHSLMARPWFEVRWTRLVPEPVERSTYVLLAAAVLAVVMWAWRPLPGVVWEMEGVLEPVLWAAYLGGWLLMFAAVFMIDGHHLLGLRQVWTHLRGRDPTPIEFQTPGAYRFVRHPIMTGFLVAFWATPRMTVSHLAFAAGMTGYILVGVRLEERDLDAAFGDRYRRYRATVPAFVPRPWRRVPSSPDETHDE